MAGTKGPWPLNRLLAARLLLCGAGGVLIAVGSFLPWSQVALPLLGTISLSGFDTGRNGDLTLPLGLALLALTLPPEGALLRLRGLLGLGIAIAVIAVAVTDLFELLGRQALIDQLGFDLIDTGVGVGLILVIVGGAIGALGMATAVAASLGGWERSFPARLRSAR